MNREPDTVAALLAELALARGADRRLDSFLDEVETELSNLQEQEYRGREITCMIATAVEASLLVRHSTAAVADAFIASRLERLRNRSFGSLPRGVQTAPIIARSRIE